MNAPSCPTSLERCAAGWCGNVVNMCSDGERGDKSFERRCAVLLRQTRDSRCIDTAAKQKLEPEKIAGQLSRLMGWSALTRLGDISGRYMSGRKRHKITNFTAYRLIFYPIKDI